MLGLDSSLLFLMQRDQVKHEETCLKAFESYLKDKEDKRIALLAAEAAQVRVWASLARLLTIELHPEQAAKEAKEKEAKEAKEKEHKDFRSGVGTGVGGDLHPPLAIDVEQSEQLEPCPLCGKIFTRQSDLMMHVDRCTGL